MPETRKRRNARLLGYLIAALFALVTFMALRSMPFYPLWLASVLALAVGLLASSSPPLASLLLVAVMAPPVLAADFVIGILFLVVGFSATQYLASDRAMGFLLIVLAAALVPFHAEWSVCVLAGYLLGKGRGATAAALACVVIEAAGIVLGRAAAGSVIAGGTAPALLALATPPADALSFGWLADAVAAADPGRALDAFLGTGQAVPLVVQPLLWGMAAVVGGLFRDRGAGVRALGAVAAGIALIAGASATMGVVLDGPIPLATYGLTAAISLVVAIGVTATAEWVFPLIAVEAPVVAPAPPAGGVRAEDADVDELLGMIASAEDALASRHRAQSVVLITDMKSFSAMTEEVGSIESAKLVQRHRDLLLPVVDRHNGHGKSTGGDGLVAAFPTPREAIEAAIDMQRTLQAYCESDVACQEVLIRIGIAEGEVVLDKSGRPFLGAALNLAARVMDLADGGRIMVVGPTAASSGLDAPVLFDHGAFKLKNISEPVHVVEVLWRDALEPQEIRAK